MKRFVWLIGVGLAVLWTLFSIGAYALVSAGGDWLILQSDQVTSDPESVVWIAWTLDFVQDFGVFLLIVLWAVVVAVILGLTSLANRLLARRDRIRTLDRDRY